MTNLFLKSAYDCSKSVTQLYSTSFNLGIKTLHKRFHQSVYAIYGFVRYADEIVDTFHDQDQLSMINAFEEHTRQSILIKISINPILNAFQDVVNTYAIPYELINAFFESMRMDLQKKTYDEEEYKKYIYGSAEVVGLMCLHVFSEGDQKTYAHLEQAACSLGSAFQKVNFLRDMKSDYLDRGRVYFPHLEYEHFDQEDKEKIERDIAKDFEDAYRGIQKLPKGAKLGVYLAYIYYLKLFKKIQKLPHHVITQKRVRVPNNKKIQLLISSFLMYKAKLI